MEKAIMKIISWTKKITIIFLLLCQSAAFAVLSETTVNSISEMTVLSRVDVVKIVSNTGSDGKWIKIDA